MSNSDRWSKASSDSEASLFILQGDIRLDLPRAVDLKDSLTERIGFVSGGRDKNGVLLISCPRRLNIDDTQLLLSLQRVINYLPSTQRIDDRDRGFSLLLESKSASSSLIKPLFKWLQDTCNHKINTVYLFKIDGFTERPKSVVGSGKYRFEVMLSATNSISQHISVDQLTEEFGGTLKFNQRTWLSMRLVFEKFLFESMALSTKLDEIKQSLLQEDFSTTVDGICGQLQHHQHVRKWIVKAPIEILQEESLRVAGVVMETSGVKSEEAMDEERRNIVLQIRSMVQTLMDQRECLRELWHSRKIRLEQCYQFNVYKEDAEKMLGWIQENRKEFLVDYTEIGGDFETTQELVEENQSFETACYQVQSNVDSILMVAKRLHEIEYSIDPQIIDTLATKLHSEWTKLYVAVQRRTALLQSALNFQRSRNEYSSKGEKWMNQLEDLEQMSFTEVVHVEDAIMSHNALKQIMSSAYEKVNTEGQALFTALQRPPSSDDRDPKVRSRVSDYTSSASIVMDAVVEMHELNRLLSIKWEKVSVLLHQRTKLCLFELESRKVLDWVDSTGLRFLLDNDGNYGHDLLSTEKFLEEQKIFEKSAEDTRLQSERLIESALLLAESRECNPYDIEEKSYELEKKSTHFFNRLSRRKELLEMTINFFSSARELSLIVEDLQEDLKLDDQTSENVDTVDAILEKHRHVCQTTLSSLINAIQEGDKLSKSLSEGDCFNDQGDTKDSKVINPATKISIEKFLRELNLSKQQLLNLLIGKQQRLDYWVQVKAYERLHDEFTKDLSSWMCEWKEKDLASDVNRASVMLAKYKKECSEMERLFSELLSKGNDLSAALKACDVEVTLVHSENHKQDSLSYIEELLVSLEAKQVGFAVFCADLKTRFEQCKELKAFESDTKRVACNIRNGEKMLLDDSHEPVCSLLEAEAQMRDYEQFQIAIEKTRLSVSDIQSAASHLLTTNHYDPDMIRSCAESVDIKWEQLMRRSEKRKGIVFASYNFFRASEQVTKLLSKFSKDCRADNDPCLDLSDYEPAHRQDKLLSMMRQYEQEKHAIVSGCKEVKESSQHFLRQILPQEAFDKDRPTEPDSPTGKLEILVGDIVEQVTCQEPFVTKQLQLKYNVLAGCLEFVKFEASINEAIQWIEDHDVSLSSDPPLEEIDPQEKQRELKEAFEEIREKVKHLLQEASTLMPRTHFHAKIVHNMAITIDTKYKNLVCQVKNHRLSLEVKLGISLPEFESEDEWPSLSDLQLKANEVSSVTRREVSSDSGIHELTEEKRRSAKRIEFIMNELLQTERAYCNDLKCCIENFLFPMLDSPHVPTPLVNQHDVIFGNIEEIYEFHSTSFLQSLEAYEVQPEDVGTCFVKQCEKFQMYVDYCANKPQSSSLLIEHGETFFEDLQAKRNTSLPLAAYLIKPVQRITKYQLLLKELLSCSDDTQGTLKKGLDVMLSVPRQANDTMYICMIEGFNDGSLEMLGRILVREAFTVWDPKHMLRKGKVRHVFLFEKALLFSKEQKDGSGKTRFQYKGKLKTSELGITEHIAEDPCKFAVWIGEPPFTEEKRIIKADSIEVKRMWIEALRDTMRMFQFEALLAETSSYPTSPRKKSKSSLCAETSYSSIGSSTMDKMPIDMDSSTLSNRSGAEAAVDYFIALEGHKATGPNELSLEKGQIVEVLSRPPGSKSWRVRKSQNDVTDTCEGLVPRSALKRYDETVHRSKRHSVETINSQSSEDSLCVDGQNFNTLTASNKASPSPSRRRTKSVNLGTLKMRTWSRSSAKKLSMNAKLPNLPFTPLRQKTTSGGGARKLEALLGAPQKDINMLLRPTDIKASTLQRPRKVSDELTTTLRPRPSSYDCEDAGFQDGDNISEYDSTSDSNDNSLAGTPKLNVEAHAMQKRSLVLKELVQSEREYVKDLVTLVEDFVTCLSWQSTPAGLRGKESVIFGNSKALLDFHRYIFFNELQKCEQYPELLPGLFIRSEKSLELYVEYCRNKPRSMNVVREHEGNFFEDAKMKLGLTHNLSEYLMKPVQRLMKYQLYFKDIVKYSARANIDASDQKRALTVIHGLTKRANDTMNLSMLEGFDGELTSQGKLLLQDTLYVANAKSQSHLVTRHVFLFDSIIIFCEPIERSNSTVHIYRHSIETNFVGLTVDCDDDPCKFALWTKAPDAASQVFVIAAKSPAVKREWIDAIRTVLQAQFSFVKGTPNDILEHLTAYVQARSSDVNNSQDLNAFNSNDAHIASSMSTPQKHSQPQVNDKWRTQTEHATTRTGHISPSGQLLTQQPTSSLKHVKLISLEAARSLEDLTKPFPVQDRFIVLENYQAQNMEEITVHKNDVVFLVSRPKNSQYLVVRNFCRERSGLVPSNILRKMTEEDGKRAKDTDAMKYGSKIRRAASFGHTEKPKGGDRPRRSKSIQGGGFRRKKEHLHKKKAEKSNGVSVSPAKAALDRIQAQFTASLDSSDEDVGSEFSASESLARILRRETKTTFEVAPEFRVQPRDVTIDAPANVKLTCTLSGNPEPMVSWSLNNQQKIEDDDKYHVSYKNHVCSLEILRSHPSDSGSYTATATNLLGTASCSAKVTVRGLVRPAAPSNPCITVLSPTSVVLVWVNGNEGVPVSTYTVEYRKADAGLWLVAVPVVEKTSTVIEDLSIGQSYQFRVTASNEVGTSGPSASSDIIRMDTESASGVFSLTNKGHSIAEVKKSKPIVWKDKIDTVYNFHSELGRGRFSLVKKCISKNAKQDFAAKLIKRRSVSKETVEGEISVLRLFNHPAICSFHDCYETPKSWVVVMELLSGGRLFDHIIVMDNLTEEIAIGFVKQILQALVYLHDCNVVHLDLKPENLLLTGGTDPKLKITDFGDAMNLNDGNDKHPIVGSPEFSAPELVLEEPITCSSDLWSLGVIVYVLLSGVSPFYSDNTERACQNITEVRYKFPMEFFEDISGDGKDFIEDLLIRDQSSRPDAKECLNFEWIRMIEPCYSPRPSNKRISLSRLAAFNARRRYQHEMGAFLSN